MKPKSKPTESAVRDFHALLPTGREQAQKSAVIITALGYPVNANSRRRLRLLVNGAIALGLPVAAGDDGYYIPETLAEGKVELRRLDSFIIRFAARRKQLSDVLELQFSEQLPLPNLEVEVAALRRQRAARPAKELNSDNDADSAEQLSFLQV